MLSINKSKAGSKPFWGALLYGVLVILGFGILAVSAFSKNHQPQNSNTWELLRQPENLSELYFTNPTALPKKYLPGQSTTVGFTVHNSSSASQTFTYEILQENPETTTVSVLRTGSLQLNAGATGAQNPQITYADAGQHSRIIIKLPSQNQILHYWVEK